MTTYTEQEARGKFCPFMRANCVCDEAAHNAWLDHKGDWHPITCIASDCMAWRWGDPRIEPVEGEDRISTSVPRGYCGLAGKVRRPE